MDRWDEGGRLGRVGRFPVVWPWVGRAWHSVGMRRPLLLVLVGAVALAAAPGGALAARHTHKIIVNSGEAIRCPAGGAACIVTVRAAARTAHGRPVGLGRSTTAIAPATTAKLIFTMSAAGRRLLLAHGPLHAQLTVTIKHGADAPVLFVHAITVAVPRRHGGGLPHR